MLSKFNGISIRKRLITLSTVFVVAMIGFGIFAIALLNVVASKVDVIAEGDFPEYASFSQAYAAMLEARGSSFSYGVS